MYSPSYMFRCELMSLATQLKSESFIINSFDPIWIKDLPLRDICMQINYNTETCLITNTNLDKSTDSKLECQVSKKYILTILMSYKEAFKIKYNSHPLQNMILNKDNYIDDMPPDWNSYEFYIPVVRTLEDVKIVNIIKWLWNNHRFNYDAWMKMVISLYNTHRCYRIYAIENGFYDERTSAKVAINALIGPRGLIHGLWNLEVPKLPKDPVHLYKWPSSWEFDFNINDNSSFHSSSPNNSDFDTDNADSGPIGVAYNRPCITGFTSFSDSSSYEEAEASTQGVSNYSLNENYWNQRFRKRFKLYIRTSIIERRNRRAVREARRLIRLKYDKERRQEEPAFDAEAKRAEALAAERVRIKIKQRENKKPPENTTQFILQNQQPLKNYLYRYQQFNHKLRSILKHEWKWYYGEHHETQYYQQSEKHISLNCWISPVQWTKPTEENLDGFVSILTAVRQMTVFEIIVGDFTRRSNFRPLQLLLRFQNGDKCISNIRKDYGILGTGKLNWDRVMIQMMISAAEINEQKIHYNKPCTPEMLVNVARYFMGNQYNISFVKRDLLTDKTLNYNALKSEKKIKTEDGEPLDIKPKIEDLFIQSIVQRLIRGHLIAVCYDADENKRPTKNGGRTACWALLCGVIVGQFRREPSDTRLRTHPPNIAITKLPGFNDLSFMLHPEHPERENQDDLGYEYLYDSDTHLLTPLGFRSRRSEFPIDIESLKNQIEINDTLNYDLSYCIDEKGQKRHENHPEERRRCLWCTSLYVDNQMDLERDADTVWVVAMDRGRYVVWSLRELANSNRQLNEYQKNHQSYTDPQERQKSNDTYESTIKQKRLETDYLERRRNRALCTMLGDQMATLARAHPHLTSAELIEMLDLSACYRLNQPDMAKVWISAVKSAYNASTGPKTPPPPTTKPIADQFVFKIPVAPPPPPLPIPAAPTSIKQMTPDFNKNQDSLFDKSLSRSYVDFQPKFTRMQNHDMSYYPDQNSINEMMDKVMQFSFSFHGELPEKKGQTSSSRSSKK